MSTFQRDSLSGPQPMLAGLVVALIGCAFGIIGVFAEPAVFGPLAVLCGLFSLAASVLGRSLSGAVTSILSVLLGLIGAAKSAALWILLGLGALMLSAPHNTSPASQPFAAHGDIARQTATTSDPPLGDIERSMHWAEDFNARSRSLLDTFPDYERRYRDATEQMTAEAEHMRTLADPVERSQVGVAITQGGVMTDQTHVELETLRNQVSVAVDRSRANMGAAVYACHRNPASDPLTDGCTRLLAANDQMQGLLKQLADGFANLETVYQTERMKQSSLIREADGA